MPGRGTGTQAEVLGWLRDSILRGVFSGDLPTVRELAGRFGCSITPVHRALRQLQTEGRVRLLHGSGAMVVSTTRPAVMALLDGDRPTGAEPGIRAHENAARDWMLHHLARADTVQVRLQGSGDDEASFGAAVEQCLREPPATVVFAYPQRFTLAMHAGVTRLLATGIAVVHWAALNELPGCDRVESDFAEGSRLITAAMLTRGSRRPLRLAYPDSLLFERQKQAGFAAALHTDGTDLTLRIPDVADEELWMRQALPDAIKRTGADAVLAANDAQVAKVYRVLAGAGLPRPVAGYDGTWRELLRTEPGRAASGPEPLSIDRDLPELGRRLAALAVARSVGSLPPAPQRVLVTPKLHVPSGH